jgi:hypothetical protein
MESASGAAAPAGAVVGIFERAGNATIQIATDSTSTGQIHFGDVEYTASGKITYDHADDSLGFYANATSSSTPPRLFIDSTGNVGVGTTSPDPVGILDVDGVVSIGKKLYMRPETSTGATSIELGTGRTGDGSAFIDLTTDAATYNDFGFRIIRAGGTNVDTTLHHRGTGNVQFLNQEAGDFIFKTTNTERVRIDSSGNVGIGVTSPAQRLEVGGTSAIVNLDADTGNMDTIWRKAGTEYLRIYGSANNARIRSYNGVMGFQAYTSNGAVSSEFRWYNGAGETMRLTDKGNLGLGTTSPTNNVSQTALTVEGTAYGRVDVWNSTDNAEGTIYAGAGAFTISSENTISALPVPMRFGTSSGEHMRVHSNDHIGIGTTAPTYPLEVHATAIYSPAILARGAAIAGAWGRIDVQNHNAGNTGWDAGGFMYTNGGVFGLRSDFTGVEVRLDAGESTGKVTFQINHVTKVTIDSGGMNINHLPTSSAGLASGDLYISSGYVRIVP